MCTRDRVQRAHKMYVTRTRALRRTSLAHTHPHRHLHARAHVHTYVHTYECTKQGSKRERVRCFPSGNFGVSARVANMSPPSAGLPSPPPPYARILYRFCILRFRAHVLSHFLARAHTRSLSLSLCLPFSLFCIAMSQSCTSSQCHSPTPHRNVTVPHLIAMS